MNLMETPLNDLELEMAVLGAVLLEGDCIDEIYFLEPRDFSQKRNEIIFGVMRYLRDRNEPIDLQTLAGHFELRGKTALLMKLGGITYLSQMAGAVATTRNIKRHAQIVRSKAHRRRAIEISKDIVEISSGGEYTIQIVPNPDAEKSKVKEFDNDEDFFAAVEDRVYDLRPQKTSKMRSFAESKKEYFEHLKSKAAKLMTGLFQQFDAWAMIWIGWLYIIAGRPSVGKTAKALQLAYGIAKYNKKAGPVLIYSQEMNEAEVKDRMVAMVAEVNYSKLINKGGEYGFTVEEWERIEKAYAEIEGLQIFIQDSAGVTIDEIRATARQFIKEYGKIAAIIVDYLQIMEIPQRKGENRTQAIGRVTRAAKTMARNMKFVMIMLSQLDRAVDDEEPKLRHLKESGSIEQDADVVEFLWWNGEMKDGLKVIQSIFAKGRNVGLNKFRYLFRWWHQKYVELEKKDGDDDGGATNPNRGAAKKGRGAKK
ncbi:replicative DNA helicase [Paenibacillus elgii]|uniref:replicative DNA helicase n=1 Tax=Paenibacillus elgii TaxID=189691 RepID=UPI000248C94F|nr:DnaB-like helicase C-terminal domain-containing protein [Paenibacillus elgii]